MLLQLTKPTNLHSRLGHLFSAVSVHAPDARRALAARHVATAEGESHRNVSARDHRVTDVLRGVLRPGGRARALAHTHTPSSRAQEADAKHGVSSWGKWGCEASTFDWTYSGTETAYVLTGKVKVVPTGKWASCKTVEVKAGDLCVFPDGMTCRWEVTEAIDKHFNFS